MDAVIQSKLQDLGDLELAILVCLIAQEHCMISTDGSKTSLRDELVQICRSVFGLRPAVISCSAKISIEEFSEGILIDDEDDDLHTKPSYTTPTLSVGFDSTRSGSMGRFGSNTLDNRRIADVVIAVDLDLANESVQVQMLELIRSKRIFTRTAMHTASKDFMVLSVTSKPGSRLSHHLNDLFCIYHFHSADDGFLHADSQQIPIPTATFESSEIALLRSLANSTMLTPELAAYLHNIVVFLRSSRYISGGVTATATRQLRSIAKVLAPLHGLDYVPPSLITLAANKIYPHRLRLATAETERSLQWGSDPGAVRELLNGITVEWVIKEVIQTVDTPL
jgi:hypothetical protein